MAAEVDAEDEVLQVDGAYMDGSRIEERAASPCGIVRGTRRQVPDEGLLEIREAFVADRHGDGVGGNAPDCVVRAVDRIEHEERLSAPVDEPGFLTQYVERRPFVIEDSQHRLLRNPVDAQARSPVGTLAEDLRGVSVDLRDRVLDGIREFEEEPLHRATYRL